jgi:hypothetical protein
MERGEVHIVRGAAEDPPGGYLPGRRNTIMLNYELEHIYSYTVTLHPSEVIGPVPEGIRVNFYISGGEIKALQRSATGR